MACCRTQAPTHSLLYLPAHPTRPHPESFSIVEIADRAAGARAANISSMAQQTANGPAGIATASIVEPDSFSKLVEAASKVLGITPAGGLVATGAQALAEELLALPEGDPRKHKVGAVGARMRVRPRKGIVLYVLTWWPQQAIAAVLTPVKAGMEKGRDCLPLP